MKATYKLSHDKSFVYVTNVSTSALKQATVERLTNAWLKRRGLATRAGLWVNLLSKDGGYIGVIKQ